jgi:hypothetical protein
MVDYILSLLPPARRYFSDGGLQFVGAEERLIQRTMFEKGISRRKAWGFVGTWLACKSKRTNHVEGIHNAFRNRCDP